jgi:hypothetical protein
MEEKVIRKEVRKVLHELMQQMHPAYPVNGGANRFPYNDEDGIVRLPEDIDTKEDYLINWEEISDNNDLYDFPIEEFKKGIQVERAKNTIFNILDISKIVINNLQDNPHFYSNLGV